MTRYTRCVCCQKLLSSATQGRTCSRACSVQMTEFANSLRETLGLEPLYVMPPTKKEKEDAAYQE